MRRYFRDAFGRFAHDSNEMHVTTNTPGGAVKTLEFAPSRVSGDRFRVGIAAAHSGPKGPFLSLYSAEEYGHMKCFSAEDGSIQPGHHPRGCLRRRV